MRFLVISIFLSEMTCNFSCFQYFCLSSIIQAWIISISYWGVQVLVIGRRSYGEFYEKSDNINDMIEKNDDHIIVNNDTEYSGENLIDEQMFLEDKEDTPTGEKE